MDVHAYWQENRRFLLSVAAGAVVFAVGWAAIGRTFGAELRAQRAAVRRLEGDLAKELYGSADAQAAERENEALRAAVGALLEAADFAPRARFALAGGTSPESRYIGVVYEVREELLALAGRAGLALPKDLGLPAQAPTREAEIARTLECLDAIDRLVRLSIESGIARVEELRVAVDPRVRSGKPIADLEENTVRAKAVAEPRAIARLLLALQEGRHGGALLVKSAEVSPARSKSLEAVLDLELRLLHAHGLGSLEAGDRAREGPREGRKEGREGGASATAPTRKSSAGRAP